MATVSVCIVTYNSDKYIEDCLQSVYRQSFPIDSIVVVDNASTDRTRAIVESAGSKVRLIVNTFNQGFAGGQNQAIKMTTSDYVLVLNPDVRLEQNYLSEVISAMELDPRIGSATGQLIRAENPELMDSAGLELRLDRNAVDLAAGEPIVNWSVEREIFGVSGAAAVYRRSMIDDISIGGQFFDEDFFVYKEDVDVAWRAKNLGWSSIYIPSAKAFHRRNWKKNNRCEVPLFVRRHSYQNRFFTIVKNEQLGVGFFLVMIRIISIEFVKLAYIIFREPGMLASWPRIIKMVPLMLRKRKVIRSRMKEKSGSIR